jgi:FAD synthase
MSGTDFFNRLLGYFNMNFLVVGQDFRCGYKGSFGISEIQRYCIQKKISLKVCNDVILENQRISSTLIRDFIYNGEFEKVENFLGRKYVLQLETSIIKSVSPLENENVDIIINKKNILQVLPKENSFLVKIKNQNFSIQGKLFILENEICINLNKKFFYENIKNFKSFEVEF